jgi:hypothetical protein
MIPDVKYPGRNRMRGVLASVSTGLVAAVLAGAASAQSLPPDPIFCVPSSYEHDAVRAAPDQHRVLFEDSHVRVLEINLPPLAVEPVHIHALPSVIHGDTGGALGARFAYIQYVMEDGRFKEISRSEVTPTPGTRTVWSPPEGPHAIANIGPTPVRFLRTEIKPESCSR